MPIPRAEPQDARVIAHVDMDCFYVQVEQRRHPELKGLPTAVVQYNSWKGGGLIAVGYEARKFGVKRSMRGDEAKRVCPDIHLVQVPVARGKADLNTYREAGSEVVSILATKGRCERASIDEVYLDLTEASESMLSLAPPEGLTEVDEEVLKSHVLGLNVGDRKSDMSVKEWICRPDADHRDKLLACGAIIVAQLRMNVLQETSFTCSAGIAHNKMLAKLASAMHKPAQQTVVPSSSVKELLASFPIKKMKQLGGKLGSSLQCDLGVNTVGDLLQFSETKLQEHYGLNTGTWLWNIARGINGEEVQGRLLPKSHGCGKTFPGLQALRTISSVQKWLDKLCEELSERIEADLQKNKRIAQTLTLHANAFKALELEPQKNFPSRSAPLRYGVAKIQEDALRLFESGLRDYMGFQSTGWGITSLSVSASKILAIPPGTSSISNFFRGKVGLSSSPNQGSEAVTPYDMPFSPTESEHSLESSHTESSKKVSACEVNSSANNTSLPDQALRRGNQCQKNSKGKEKYSILNFFNENAIPTCISNKDQEYGLLQAQAANCSSELNNSAGCLRENLNGSLDAESHVYPTMQSSTSWPYNIDDIDPSIVDELPLEIQRELKEWLHPQKQLKKQRKGGSISDYFSPANKL